MNIFYLHLDKFVCCGSKYEKEHAAGLYLTEYAAKNFYSLKNTQIEIINSKPQFKYHKNIHFSISHSFNIAAVCFDDVCLGFDIEFIKPRNYAALAKRMNFTLKENTLEEFYKCWTVYEAEYKLQQKPLNIRALLFQNEYMLAAASSSSREIIFKFHPVN